MKNCIIMEQGAALQFAPFGEQQQQAKTGVVTPFITDIPQVAAVADSDPLRATVGSLIVESAKAIESKVVMIGLITQVLSGRKVLVMDQDDAGAAFTGGDASANTTLSAVLSFDGNEKNNAPMSNGIANGNGLSTVINAAIAARKPNFSLASIINTIEDIILDDGTKDALVFVDQFAGTIKVLTMPTANSTDAFNTAAAGAAGNVTAFLVNSTPVATTGRELGE